MSSELSGKNVAELERLATALFITNREGARGVEQRAERLVELKPHISTTSTLSSCEQVDRLIKKAAAFQIPNESMA